MKAEAISLGAHHPALPFFGELPEDVRGDAALLATRSECAANSTVFADNGAAPCLYLLTDGVVRILETGSELPPVEIASASFPPRLLLLDGATDAGFVETARACTFLVLQRTVFLAFLARSPRLLARFFSSLHPQLRILNGRLLDDALEAQAASVQAEQERARALNDVPLASGEAETEQGALGVAVERICACLGWPVGHAYSPDESSPEELFSSSIWHLQAPEQFEQFRRASDITPFPSGAELPGRAFKSRQPVWIDDFPALPGSPRAQAARTVGLRTGLALPICLNDQVVAVLEFFTPQLILPDARLMEALFAVAIRVGRAIERKRYEQQLVHNAFHDALTGLPNRALFLDHLGLSLARGKRNRNHLFAVLFLDLDRFKIINDSLGHLLADGVLVEVGRRLQSILRGSDTVARFGGDEFAVLLDDLKEISSVPRTVERIRKELQVPVRLGEREVYTSASIGVVLSSPDYTVAEDLLQDADIALYQAKTQGRARYVVFDSGMRERAVQLLQLETELRQALDRTELRVFYQPIVSLEHGRITGFEALLRWQHPQRGLLTAGEFLPVAEETEIILPISEWILREVCAQITKWQQEFPSDPPLSVSVNLTTKYLSKPDLVEEISGLIQQSGIDPRCLRLEITESQIMDDPKAIARTLIELNAAGIQVSIDDFGTGYSSLSYLSEFRVQTLKIDYSFISKLNADDRDAAIVRAVVGLGLNLGLEVVAEGVETPDQLDFLRSIQCHSGQGYYFCRPVDDTTATRLLSAGGRLDRQPGLEAARLRAFELFAGMEAADLSEIVQMAREQAVSVGTMLIRQGQVGKEVYLLERGVVEIRQEEHGASRFVAELHAPAFFGERVLLDPERVRTASVRAKTDLRLLVIRVDSFLALLRRFPALRERMRGLFVERS